MIKLLIPRSSKEHAILTMSILTSAVDPETGEVLGVYIDVEDTASISVADIVFINQVTHGVKFFYRNDIYTPVATSPVTTHIALSTGHTILTTQDYQTVYNAVYSELEITLTKN